MTDDLLEPLGLLSGPVAADAVATGDALPLAGGPLAFTLIRIVGSARLWRATELPGTHSSRLDAITRPHPRWAGVGAAAPQVMAILNVTPDSFSDGGTHADPVAAGLALARAGADIVDVGGESTRPGARPVPPDEEQRRVIPPIAALAASGAVVSIDTRNAATMAAALDAGATIVNDVSALAHDPDAPPLLAGRDCAVVLMHMRGTPETMNQHATYVDVAAEVTRELATRIAAAESAGIARSRIAIDPGIGFAKTGAHNIALLQHLPVLLNLGCPIVIGVSRKRFIGTLAGEDQPARRDPGSLAAALFAAGQGARLVRLHDAAAIQAAHIWRGLSGVHQPATVLS